MSQRNDFEKAMTGVIQSAQRVAMVERFLQIVGSGIGLAARFFGLPALAVYAWNGLTTLPDWHYWPAVAAFAVVNVLITTLKGPAR